ncbi:hypothetical protein QYE76_040876 [Lolium multiflorum]|uniref:F-box domain-containing protein n=1 Tax=Lolium multiflorum TaxID=4521 RepID=A0AAD8WVV3_LOLMU|nr:hypothetical protein QYE76_040876 [Lolium multiflorum]
MEDKADAIPDELLGLEFVRLIKPVDLVRAAVTCRRWHQIIVAESFRVLCALHGAPSTKVVGSYLVDERSHILRMPGRHPVFFPSARPPWTGAAARNLALDFLHRTKYGELIWELADVRGGSLTVVEAWALYRAGYPVPPGMRLPSNGGWRMAVNGVGVQPAAVAGHTVLEGRDQGQAGLPHRRGGGTRPPPTLPRQGWRNRRLPRRIAPRPTPCPSMR